jgi:2-C-methyl-D-erythritol 4-phosphate cytidylyltransferase
MRYFLATYFKKPSGKFNEQVKLDTKVRMNDLRSASVIIDYKERKIVKSNFEEELGPGNQHDFETINNFYKTHYPQLISQLEAKYEVLHQAIALAKDMVDEIKEAEANGEKVEFIATDDASVDVAKKLDEIAKNDIAG